MLLRTAIPTTSTRSLWRSIWNSRFGSTSATSRVSPSPGTHQPNS